MIKDITFGHITCERDFQKYLGDVVEGEPVVIKPNWTNSLPASLSHFQAFKKLLSCLEGKEVIVVESYTAWRNRLYRQHFEETGSIMWDECVKPHNAKEMWEWLKKEDEWFLDFFGFTKRFQENEVEYVNVTEEIWNGRGAPAEEIKAYVGERQSLVRNTAFYEMIPDNLIKLRGCTLLNFTKLYKTGIHAGKNLMGLIPDPNRREHHGEKDSNLIQTIHDINIIYRSLFKVVDVVESLIKHNIVISGTNPAQLDEVGCVIMGGNLVDTYHDIPKARELFGAYPPIALSDIPQFVFERLNLNPQHR